MFRWVGKISKLPAHYFARLFRVHRRGAVRLPPGAVSRRTQRPFQALRLALVHAASPRARAEAAARVRDNIKAILLALGLTLSLACVIWPIKTGFLNASIAELSGVTHKMLSRALKKPFYQGDLPETLDLDQGDAQLPARIEYTMDPILQKAVKKTYKSYNPDYAAFVAMDAESGKILCMVDYVRRARGSKIFGNSKKFGNLITRNTFPAASVMKLVTAAAAIDLEKIEPHDTVSFNGAGGKLYKQQVLRHKKNKYTNHHTLEEAFARSMNPAFGRIGVEMLGHQKLREYAEDFGFNDRSIGYDVPIPTGKTHIRRNDWHVAQISSGFTLDTTLSPLHGAMLAAAIVNDGRMPVPYLVSNAYDENDLLLYMQNPARGQQRQVISAEAASKVRKLMQATVVAGSAARPFRGFHNGRYSDIEVGGKTGTMSSTKPPGRTDWFIGYADLSGRKIAFASLNIIQGPPRRGKSAFVARRFIETLSDKKPMQIAGDGQASKKGS